LQPFRRPAPRSQISPPASAKWHEAERLAASDPQASQTLQHAARAGVEGEGATGSKGIDRAIDDVKAEPKWKSARDASLHLAEKCRQCRFMEACGGGYLPHRFSKKNGYDNPSAYCTDLYAIFSHIQSTLERQVYISKPSSGAKIGIGEAVVIAQREELQPPRIGTSVD
jgi:uncharacterized protein